MTPLENRLTDALASDVARFDALNAGVESVLPDLERMERDLLPLRLAGRPPRERRRKAMAVVAAALLICLGIAGLAARHDDSSGSDPASVPSSTTSIVAPQGVEQPLVEGAVSVAPEVARPGSVHAFKVAGHPDLLIWTTLSPNPLTGEVEEWQCVREAGSSGCGPTSIPAVFGQTSSIDNNFATDDLFTWSNLPADVATVGYDDGVVQLWQRPVAGLAIFRVDPNHPHPSLTAFDATGTALPYSFWGQNSPVPPASETSGGIATENPSTAETGPDSWADLHTLTQSSIYDCLTSSGASWPVSNVPSFKADVDPVAIWDSCVEGVKTIVAARVAELTKGK
jgi:hypothetical protein